MQYKAKNNTIAGQYARADAERFEISRSAAMSKRTGLIVIFQFKKLSNMRQKAAGERPGIYWSQGIVCPPDLRR